MNSESMTEFLSEAAMLEVKADIRAGKLSATDCDPDLIIDALVRKLINRRMTTTNFFGLPEYTVMADRGAK